MARIKLNLQTPKTVHCDACGEPSCRCTSCPSVGPLAEPPPVELASTVSLCRACWTGTVIPFGYDGPVVCVSCGALSIDVTSPGSTC